MNEYLSVSLVMDWLMRGGYCHFFAIGSNTVGLIHISHLELTPLGDKVLLYGMYVLHVFHTMEQAQYISIPDDVY